MNKPKACPVGVVAIGRNEGERLRACLQSVVELVEHVVYVDSGSTDGSVAMAQAMGVHVVNLDMTVPFTAARARNEGWRALLALAPDLTFIQFVDGDCVVADGWLQQAQAFMQQRTGHAVVCGRRREKFPEKSIYNRLCDLEWNTPVGEAKSCGGDALMRVTALQQVGGYRADLIAGEEPEMCVRLRQTGWHIQRLDAEMTLHDAAMTRFGQWWKRAVRAGYAYANGMALHGAAPTRHGVVQVRRALLWGVVLPLTIAAFAFCNAWVAVLALAYPLQVGRLAVRERARGAVAWPLAMFWTLGRFPESVGILKFAVHRWRRVQGGLIEYK